MFEVFEASGQDILFRIRDIVKPSGNVVLLAIDNKSIDYLGPWPWNHQRIAQLVEALTYYKPKAVVVQFEIKENVEDFVSGTSQLLAENILQSNDIVLPFFPTLSNRTPKTSTTPEWLKRSALTSILPFEGENVPIASRLELPGDLFGPSGKLSGAALTHFDPDNKVRTQPLLLKFEKNFYPSLELATVALAIDVPLDQIRFDQNNGKLDIGNRTIPVDREGRYVINYYGPASTFPWYSVKDFWDGEIEIEQFKNKIIIIATTATGLSDKLATPVGTEFTPAEESATVIENILTGRSISRLNASSNTSLLIIFGIGILCALILPRVALMHRYVILAVLGFLLLSFDFVLFSSYGTLVSIFYPALEILLFAFTAPLLARRASKEIHDQPIKKPQIKQKEKPITEKPAIAQEQKLHAESTDEVDITRNLKSEDLETQILKQMSQTIDTTRTERLETSTEQVKQEKSLSDTDQRIPATFGRYEVLETLGKGAMGTVYKGKDPVIDRMVALKTIRLDKIADPAEIDELRERLTREAKAAGNLSHPNIVTIYDVGQDGDIQYIAMEYLEGYTLEQIINRKLELNFRIAAKVVFQVCSALSYAHRHDIIHRDIKPANIMVLENFHVKVMDFGIAHFGSSNLTQTGMAMGTPNYISPEQLKGEPVTQSSDIFSLGVVFYEMLTGKKPFIGDNISNLILKIINDNPPPPSSINEKIPPMLDLIVKKALDKNPYNRYHSADEMSRVLEDFVTDLTTEKARF